MIKAVIFDFNGTLYDDSAIHITIWKELYKDITKGRGEPDDFINRIIGTQNSYIVREIYKDINQEISDEDVEKISKDKERRYREYSVEHNLCHLIKGAEEVMDYIKERYPMNLSTNSIDENVDFFFKEFKIGRWFERNKITNDNGILKTKSEMYKKAAENIGVDLKDCLIFEDSAHGIKEAYEAGCRNIILIDPKQRKISYPGVIQTVKDYTEVKLNIFDC